MSDAIGVPAGGGALTGIGETFQPDLHTGTAHFSVPMPLPPGRGILVPTLALSYSSAAGNGPFGMGWSLDVPRIARRTDGGIPRYDDALDTFVLSGAEELAPVPLGNAAPPDLPPTASALRYRPRTETLFARIVHVTGGGQDYWDIRTRDGLRSTYGTVRPADAADDWADPATIRTPDGAVFAWLLSQTCDTFGSRIRYRYGPNPSTTADPQRYLNTVEYGEYGDLATPAYAVTVTLSYDDHRGDPFSDCRPGFELPTALRASLIAVTTVGSPDSPVTTVDLGYAATDHTLLSSVTVTGHDPTGGLSQSLSPVTFAYTGWNPAERAYQRLSDILPPAPLGADTDLVDAFGDGLPSVLQLGSAARYWRNLGGGRFALPRPLPDAPSATLGEPGTLLSDLNGDARPELVTTTGGVTVWPLAEPDPATDRMRFAPPHRPGPSLGTRLTDLDTRLMDLDGDHLLDLVTSVSSPLVATGDGTGGWADLRRLDDPPPPLTNLADPHVRVAAMTGCGLSDLVLVHDRSVRYWPSLGRGRFGPPVQMGNAPHFSDATGYPGTGFDPRRLLIGDVTGDGTADFVYVGDGAVTIWLNITGHRFTDPTVIYGTPRVDSRTDARLADVLGTGVSGLLWSGLGRDGGWAFLDLTGGVKPFLLSDIDNHRGASIHLTWSTSTQYAVADRTAGRPWATTLPFPVHVIAATETRDYFAGTVLTSALRYHDGYWDPGDREFRGFGCVEHTDTLAPQQAQPPAPARYDLLDPLTPPSTVPDGFDATAHGNLLQNWSFDTPTPGTTVTVLDTTQTPDATGSGDAAAQGWTTWNTIRARTTTELLPSTLPQGRGGSMIHLTTQGPGCGLVNRFGAPETGPARVEISVWVLLVNGSVRIGTGNGGSIAADAVLEQAGEWTLVSAGNQRSPANELIIHAANDGPCEFYVDHAWTRVADVPPDPLDSPPLRSVTWYHLGPIGPATGAWTDLQPEARYWPNDPPLLAHVDTSALPPTLPRNALREALRAARGRVLRTETYGDDHSDRAGRPYDVEDHAYESVPVLDGRAPDDPTWQTAPVVAIREVLRRDSEWDRGDDPMTKLDATGGYDEYNRPTLSVTAGVERARDPRTTSGDPCLATVTTTTYATRDDPAGYFLDTPSTHTRHEAIDPGTTTVLDFLTATLAGHHTGDLRAVDATYYDGPAYTGLPLGELGDHAQPTRTEHLVLTPERLTQICAPLLDGGTATDPPPYLDPTGGTPWTAGYPPEFIRTVTDAPASRGPHLGYVWHDGTDLPEGWYAPTAQRCYDAQQPQRGQPARGLVVASRDAYGGDTTHEWDSYDLLLVRSTDPARLTTSASYDYRVFKPLQVVDPNANHTLIGYTPLGLPAWISKQGKDGERAGDTTAQPGQLFDYDLQAWDTSAANDPSGPRQPMRVTTLRRVDHRWAIAKYEDEQRQANGLPPLTDAEITALFPATEAQDLPDRFIRSVQYTDGSGRLLQTRTQADDLIVSDVGLPWDASPASRTVTSDPNTDQDRVIVSGWQTYDNKGRTVVAREPFFDLSYEYTPADVTPMTQLAAVRQHYDPRGRKTVTVGADGSQTRYIYGRPADLADPHSALPSPWETWTYDPIDNSGRTHPTENLTLAPCWDTAASSECDSLGRTVRTVAHGITKDVVTLFNYDIDGNIVTVIDPLSRTAAGSVYDHSGNAWTSRLLDAGTTRTFVDAAGGKAEHRDDKGALTLTSYDPAHRHVDTWAADYATQTPTLREVIVYGDDHAASGVTPDDATKNNLLGRLTFVLDESGQATTSAYDLDGNATETRRQVLRPDLLLSTLPATGSGQWTKTAYVVNWQNSSGQTPADHAAQFLDPTSYATSITFDALGRSTATLGPFDVTGARATINHVYCRGGGITGVVVDGDAYVHRIIYDAHGRRSLAYLGNGTLLRYAYDPQSLRLRRVRAEHATAVPAAPATAAQWTCDGPVLQDLTYRVDLTGNPLTIADRAPGCGIPPANPNALDRQFGYDALYRLTTATGRETAKPDGAPPWDDQPRSWDVNRARSYQENYTYDLAGNLLTLQHSTNISGIGAYTRLLPIADGTNQLTSVTVGALTVPYTYDACGNMLTEAANRHLEWDHINRLSTFRDQAGSQQPTVYAQYRYDPIGNRVIKIVRRISGPDLVTLYLGGFERLLVGPVGGSSIPYDEVHLTDHHARLALIRRGEAVPDDGLADHGVLYLLGDHLANLTATLDATSNLLNREEFLPYGETSFGSHAHKRYRQTSKERDEESGFGYHGARYYAAWLCRWTTTDPVAQHPSLSSYAYCNDKPLTRIDPDGRADETAPLGVTSEANAPPGLNNRKINDTNSIDPALDENATIGQLQAAGTLKQAIETRGGRMKSAEGLSPSDALKMAQGLRSTQDTVKLYFLDTVGGLLSGLSSSISKAIITITGRAVGAADAAAMKVTPLLFPTKGARGPVDASAPALAEGALDSEANVGRGMATTPSIDGTAHVDDGVPALHGPFYRYGQPSEFEQMISSAELGGRGYAANWPAAQAYGQKAGPVAPGCGPVLEFYTPIEPGGSKNIPVWSARQNAQTMTWEAMPGARMGQIEGSDALFIPIQNARILNR